MNSNELAKEVVRAMCTRNVGRLTELFAPDLRFHTAQSVTTLHPDGGVNAPLVRDPTFEGRDAYLASYTAAEQDIVGPMEEPDFVFVAGDGEAVVPLVWIRAKLADGTPYENLYCFPMRFKDGQVVEMWEVHDTAYAFPLYKRQIDNARERAATTS
jgi:ketosteroid isomerase-like protein